MNTTIEKCLRGHPALTESFLPLEVKGFTKGQAAIYSKILGFIGTPTGRNLLTNSNSTVYLVYGAEMYEGRDILGLFTSKYKAELFIDGYIENIDFTSMGAYSRYTLEDAKLE